MKLGCTRIKRICNGAFVNTHAFTHDVESKFAIILAHDVLDVHDDFHFLIKRLYDKYNVITFDLAGHGSSGNLDKYNYDVYLQDCMNVVNLAKNRLIVWIGKGVGFILGAKLAAITNSTIFGLVGFDFCKYQNAGARVADVECEYTNLQKARLSFYQKYNHIPTHILNELFLYRYKILNSKFVNNYHINLLTEIDKFFGVDMEKILDDILCHSLLFVDSKNSFKQKKILDFVPVNKDLCFLHENKHLDLIENFVDMICNDGSYLIEKFRR
ncbi:MAG: alpha/beta hydrolase [Alphaproteobacteria bacterium]|nr:MAG: alpha/beta hydrolase [Alphaproteobacteria bacterium]